MDKHPNTPNFPPGFPQTPISAFAEAGYDTLDQLAGQSKSKLLALHGVGPKGIRMLEHALADAGLAELTE